MGKNLTSRGASGLPTCTTIHSAFSIDGAIRLARRRMNGDVGGLDARAFSFALLLCVDMSVADSAVASGDGSTLR